MNGEEVRNILRANLKRLRAEKRLSQLALALQVGLAHNFINDIENGKKWISPDTIAKLSQALDVEPYQLFLPSPILSNEEKALVVTCFNELSESVNAAMQSVRARYIED